MDFALAALLIALALYGYRARPHSAVNRWFALQTLTLALWSIGVAGTHTSHHTEFWGRWTFASACLMPPAFFGFTCMFPENSRPRPVRALPLVIIVALSFATLSAFTPLIAHTFVIIPTGLRRQAGPLMPLFSLYFLLSTVSILGLLIFKWRRATGQARAQLRFYNTGLLTLCVGAITTNLLLPTLTGHSEYSTLGPYFVLPLVGLIGHAIIRHRLFDLRLMIHRGAAFLIFIGLVSASIVLILKQMGLDEAFGAIAPPFEGLVVLIVASISLSVPVAPHLARLMDNYLLRPRPDLDYALHETARRLSRLLAATEIAAEIEAILRSTLAVEVVTVATSPLVRHNLPVAVHEAAWAIAIPPPAVLLLSREPDASATVTHAKLLRDNGFEVWVALGRGTQKMGVILLGPRNGGEAYLESTLQFIEGLTELSSMALEVAFLYEHQITLEGERHQLEHFARMGRAYAGLGHEIRTPLTTISNLVSLIPDRLDDSEFRDVLTRLIPGEVARIVKLTERLRLMAPADSAQFGPVDLRNVLAGIASIQSVSRNHIKVLLDLPEDLPVVRGDESQLIQLFMNLVNNAVEAMPDGGVLGLQLQTSNSAQGHLVLTAYVVDEGPGIPKDIVDRVFEPFFTTKPSGTGLGLSICREIAGFHSAILRIFSRDDRIGTIAAVEFPLGPKHQATLSDFEASVSTSSWASPNQ